VEDSARYLLDRLAIQDLLTRYATAVDRRDLTSFRACFTEDVLVRGFGPAEIHGVDDWLEFVASTLRTFGVTQHLIGNFVVEFHDHQARVRADLQASHELLARPGEVVVLWATYHSLLVRTEQGWKICEHRLEPRLTRTLAA
jgi:3-phenylpropionate/cinnamic acid dioxygenase small subunit